MLVVYLTEFIKKMCFTHLCPFSKSKFNLYEALKPDRVNFVTPASPVHRVWCSTNWDRKG